MIDREASQCLRADALSDVRGYIGVNDVSARDVQFADGQWVRAKCFDTFCPLGSELVQIDDPQALKLVTRVNGEVVQDSNTSEMIFGVAELISFCSQNFVLDAGDVILTGTPWGCGEFMEPEALAPGRRRGRVRDRRRRNVAQPGRGGLTRWPLQSMSPSPSTRSSGSSSGAAR